METRVSRREHAAAAPLSRPVRLLVIDGSAVFRHRVQQAFEAPARTRDWGVTLAGDAYQALEMLEGDIQFLPHLILLDWGISKASGLLVLQHCKADQRPCTIPVLVFSATNSEAEVEAVYTHHANGYIEKPQDLGELDQIAQVIENFWMNTAQLPRPAGLV